MSSAVDVTIVLNAHREGSLAHASVESARAAAEHARRSGLEVEMLVVLDRPDAETRSYFNEYVRSQIPVHEVEYGDLGLSRNHGVAHAAGEFVAFLDCDDLWGKHWLEKAVRFSRAYGRNCICHPQYNLFWGMKSYVWEHLDQEAENFSLNDLLVTNPWTALSFARRVTYETVPYRFSSLIDGIGYEDWGWNCDVIAAGFVHKVVPNTIHFVRAKEQGLLVSTNAASCLNLPSDEFRSFYRQHLTAERHSAIARRGLGAPGIAPVRTY